eukprot:scaffold389_cov382-Prasinococcus_capsulatus_cf.AAC.26
MANTVVATVHESLCTYHRATCCSGKRRRGKQAQQGGQAVPHRVRHPRKLARPLLAPELRASQYAQPTRPALRAGARGVRRLMHQPLPGGPCCARAPTRCSVVLRRRAQRSPLRPS